MSDDSGIRPEGGLPVDGPRGPGRQTRVVAAWIVIALLAALALCVLVLMQRSCAGPVLTGGPTEESATVTPSQVTSDQDLMSEETSEPLLPEDQDFGQFNTSHGGDQNQLPGTRDVIVPDVNGLTRSSARAKVEAAGLRYYEIPRPTGPYMKTWGQFPKAGAVVDSGSQVTVLYGIVK